MCVVADTDNKVGRSKIDPRGKISLFVGYSTQHAGDVYRLLNPKTSRRDVKWTGKRWSDIYKIKMIDRASGYVDPDEDVQLEEEEDQDIDEEDLELEEDDSDAIHVEKLQFSLFFISCCQGILNSSWLSWYLVLKIACLHVSFTANENFYKLSNMYCLLVWFSTFQSSEVSEKQRSNNQTYFHLYTDLIIHKYICDRSLSGDPFHIVNPFLNAKGLFKCDSTHISNLISVQQSVCLSSSDLGFNILPVVSHFG